MEFRRATWSTTKLMRTSKVQDKQNAGQQHKKKVHEIVKNEFGVVFGSKISARIHGQQGQLWDDEHKEPEGMEQPVNFFLGHHVLLFKEIKTFVLRGWERLELEETNPWWRLSSMQEESNESRCCVVMLSQEKALDEQVLA
jgi:hypothetical protein